MAEFGDCELDEEFHLLIPSRFPPVPLYSRLGGPEIQRAAEVAEGRTNPRAGALGRISQSAAQTNPPQLQNWNLAPFAYANPIGSTFLEPGYRVLELLKGERPAVAHAVIRREAFLGNTREPPIRIEMRLLVRRVTGVFVDLTGTPSDADSEARRRIGAEIYESGASGILFRRSDLGGARSASIFDGSVLGRAVQGDHFRFEWNGELITQIGNLSSHEVIQRERLFAGLEAHAASVEGLGALKRQSERRA